jgi:hypothetical protein
MEMDNKSGAETTDLLRRFCDNGFDGSLAQARLALGRPEDELQRMLDGSETVDEDLLMKVRGIAQTRNIDIGVQFADDDASAAE